MKRIWMRPGKVVYVSEDAATRAANAARAVAFTKDEVRQILRAFPRRPTSVTANPPRWKASLRRSPSTAKVLAKVHRMLEESGSGLGTQISIGDVERWVDVWMATRQPALRGRTPAELMQLEDGWNEVESLLEQLRDGGFA